MYDTTKQNASKGTWADEGEKMSKVEDYGVDLTKKYSIWKFELTEEDLEKYNAAVFYFRYGNDWMRYSTVTLHAGGSDTEYGNVTENDQNNWTKYIYATYSKDVNGQKEFAIQSYLSYDEFKARDMADIANGGRQKIYLLGWDGMQYFKENGNEPTGDAIGFPGDLIKDNLLTVGNDHGCFFLPIKSTSDNARFKISWINPKAYAPASPDGTGASLAPSNAIGSYEGFKVANARMATPVTFIVNPNNAVSSMEDIFDEIDADNAPVEYYTISGVRVMGQPATGLYIRRQGDKVSKVVIR